MCTESMPASIHTHLYRRMHTHQRRDQIKNARKMLKSQFGDAGVVKFARSVRGKRELEKWTPQTKWLSVNERELFARQAKKQHRVYDAKQRYVYVRVCYVCVYVRMHGTG